MSLHFWVQLMVEGLLRKNWAGDTDVFVEELDMTLGRRYNSSNIPHDLNYKCAEWHLCIKKCRILLFCILVSGLQRHLFIFRFWFLFGKHSGFGVRVTRTLYSKFVITFYDSQNSIKTLQDLFKALPYLFKILVWDTENSHWVFRLQTGFQILILCTMWSESRTRSKIRIGFVCWCSFSIGLPGPIRDITPFGKSVLGGF